MPTQTPVIDFVENLAAISMILGWSVVLWGDIQSKTWKALALNLLVPFYVLRTVLKMEESNKKKLLAISLHGAFFVFFVAHILKLVMTPPS
ncbi:MAG: hypothetical protein JNM63_09120 [Spirochaetia bacterium]|nr:hypothetical protein [Spirochaetia bacterium]